MRRDDAARMRRVAQRLAGALDASMAARVVAVGRNAAWIAFEDSDELQLAALPKRLERLALVPGDLVRVTRLAAGRVIVESREPRTSALERRTGSGRTKTMAANIDGIAIVAAFAEPPFHAAMVDELLAFAELHELAARLILTKADLARRANVDAIVALYRGLGYAVLVANPRASLVSNPRGRSSLDRQERSVASRRTRTRIEAIEEALRGHRTLLIGQSGVGKSSIFRALGGPANVGEVSRIGRGRQTTTSARLHHFADGFMIDSPGVSEFELHGIAPSEVAGWFVEFRPFFGRCRFTDCSHRGEPGCAVVVAVESGEIARSRYESYRAILARG